MLADCSPEEVKALGHELIDREEHAAIRAGISRFYYANFLRACEKLTKTNQIELRGQSDDHSKLIAFLRKSGKKKALGDQLKTLQSYRYHADYHFDAPRKDCPICTGNAKLDAEGKKAIKGTADKVFCLLNSL